MGERHSLQLGGSSGVQQSCLLVNFSLLLLWKTHEWRLWTDFVRIAAERFRLLAVMSFSGAQLTPDLQREGQKNPHICTDIPAALNDANVHSCSKSNNEREIQVANIIAIMLKRCLENVICFRNKSFEHFNWRLRSKRLSFTWMISFLELIIQQNLDVLMHFITDIALSSLQSCFSLSCRLTVDVSHPKHSNSGCIQTYIKY